MRSPVKLTYQVPAGASLGAFLTELAGGRIRGARCPTCDKVYVPVRGACPADGTALPAPDTDVAETGIVTTYCVVNIPFEGQVLTPPYVAGAILLDGADVPIFHLIAGAGPDDARMGMRVKAKWREDPIPSLATIEYFEPTGEPDAPFEAYKDHL